MILAFFFRLILVLRRTPDAIPTSWWRSVEDNREEGGDPESQHLFGLAADIVVPSRVLAGVLGVARGLGLTAVNERTHVHLQLFPKGALARAGVVFPS